MLFASATDHGCGLRITTYYSADPRGSQRLSRGKLAGTGFSPTGYSQPARRVTERQPRMRGRHLPDRSRAAEVHRRCRSCGRPGAWGRGRERRHLPDLGYVAHVATPAVWHRRRHFRRWMRHGRTSGHVGGNVGQWAASARPCRITTNAGERGTGERRDAGAGRGWSQSLWASPCRIAASGWWAWPSRHVGPMTSDLRGAEYHGWQLQARRSPL
jgi:hypothetical protein